MILLDITVVNVALPRIQANLDFSPSGLTWVVNGYVLAAGGLLLLGGRLADVYGRRRLLLTGIALFAVSSAVSGAAVDRTMMVIGRFGQGAAEALAAPASLGLIALMFSDPAERTKALGIWGGLAAIGGTLGYVLSGVLTGLGSWRWIFFVNIPVAAVVLAVLPRLVRENRMIRADDERLDAPGAATATLGLVAVVYGLLNAADHDWASRSVAVPLAGGALLLALTVFIEHRTRTPLIPLTFFANRTRSVINATSLLFMAAFISYTFMLTLFEQDILDYSPLISGLSWLPLGFSIGAGIGAGTALTPRLGVRTIATAGFCGAGLGLLVTAALIDTSAHYLTGVLPGMVVFGLCAGATMPAATNAALHGVTGQDAGLASGVQSTMQQIGGALGLAVLVPLAVRHAHHLIAHGEAARTAVTAGYITAFRVSAALMILGGLVVLALFERVDPVLRDPAVEAANT
ncbi:MAG: MFS transporter [Mycobacteriaceae bacterium]|nr:MFS transporter [Mycobacteriaceae bacterium]